MGSPGMPRFGRREFLIRTSTLGVANLLGVGGGSASAEPPPETPRIRFVHAPFICIAPQYLAEELLALEGISECEYLPLGVRVGLQALAEGRADLAIWNAPELLPHLDVGRPIVALSGVHGGCYQLFGGEGVPSDPRSQGQNSRHPLPRKRRPRTTLGPCWHTSALTRGKLTGSPAAMSAMPWTYSPRAGPTLSVGYAQEPSGAAREEDRACDRGHIAGSPMVAVLLLHGRGQPRLCTAQPDRDQARPAGDPQGQPTSAIPSRSALRDFSATRSMRLATPSGWK